MGTLADGTRCYYCDAEAAGYILDAGGPIGQACLSLYVREGGLALSQVRLRRRVAGWSRVAAAPGPASAATAAGLARPGFRLLLTVGGVAEHIAAFCIWP